MKKRTLGLRATLHQVKRVVQHDAMLPTFLAGAEEPRL